MELSIIMPCLNEALTLPVCIKKARQFLQTSGIDGEIIVADNGSTDGSIEIAESLGARVVRVPIKGYGAALSAGIHEARGLYCIMGDSDDSYDFLQLQPFVDKLREGYDLVMGNRFMGGIKRGAMPPLHRYFGNPMLSLLGRTIYEHKVCGDFYCGLRGFRKASIENLRLQSTGMEFALEMVIKSTLFLLKITEVPTTLSPDGRDRRPHLRTFTDGWRSLRLYLLMSPRWVFGVPGLASMFVGALLVGIWLLDLLPADWDSLLSIMSVVAIVLGYQSTLLAIFAKFIAIEVNLHPPKTKFWMLRESGTLERFLIAGAVLMLLSFAAALVLSFVPTLFNANLSRQLSALVTIFLILGGQTFLAGFYFGLLNMLTERKFFPRKRSSDYAG